MDYSLPTIESVGSAGGTAGLVDPAMTSFMNGMLRQCHEYKLKYQSALFNWAMIVFIFVIAGLFVYMNYRGIPTEEERREREEQKRQYIMQRLRNYQEARLHASQDLITGLPLW